MTEDASLKMLIQEFNIDFSKLSRDYEKNPLKRGERPSLLDIQYLYLDLNMTQKELGLFFHRPRIDKILKEMNVQKSKEMQTEAIKRTNLKRYGSMSSASSQEVKDKMKQTNLERYGAECPLCNKKIRAKIEKNNLKKYGCKNPLSNEEVRAKIRKTNLEHYDVEHVTQREDIKEKLRFSTKNAQAKMKQTNLKKYGVEHVSQIEEVRAKIKKTNLEHYGVECVFQREGLKESIRDKAVRTNIERYGYRSPMQNKDVQAKMKQTNLEKYGCENPMQNKDVQAKMKQTNLEKYGCENPFGNKEIQQKIRKTNLERHGTEHPLQIDSVKDKVKKTNLERYGVEWGFGSKEIQKKIKQTNLEKYGYSHVSERTVSSETLHILSSRKNMIDFIENNCVQTPVQMAELLDFNYSSLCKHLHKQDLWDVFDHYSSSYEAEINSLFSNVFVKTRKPIFPYEIDLYSEEHKFGIEFNGNYWHSEIKLPSNYHQKKSLLAEDKGIFLYHIWEYEWLNERKKNIIISQIKNILGMNGNKIFARKCELKNVSPKEATLFLQENHMQGTCPSSINLGLYYQNELVSIMTFGKPRFNKNYEWELLRFCSKREASIIGGASKLFKNFIKEYNPTSIMSYSHIDKGSGKLYMDLGFVLSKISNPDYVWWKDFEVLSRYQCQKHKLAEQGFRGSNEREIMTNRGYRRIFGCGNKVWIKIID